MLDSEVIKKLSVKNRTTETNIAREYMQHLFLSFFYQHLKSENVLFKGDTALHIIFQSPRFSEDLDFSGFSVNLEALENLVLATISEMEKVGLKVEIIESKATSGGYLSILYFVFLKFNIRILLEVSLRKQNDIKGEPILVSSEFIPSYTLLILPEGLLIEEKLNALLGRGKARDYFDLYFLLRKGLIKVKQRKVLKEIRTRVIQGNLPSVKELEDFLPHNLSVIIRDFQEVLLREISRYV